jgi:hypothetical protein
MMLLFEVGVTLSLSLVCIMFDELCKNLVNKKITEHENYAL